jgi:hypothetical protein
MFDSGILDVAIGVAFVFLLVSTLCSAIREGIESLLKTRATYLEYAVRELLGDRDGKGLTTSVFAHPLIRGLFQGDYQPRSSKKPSLLQLGRDLPSYIPARSFAAALIDIAARGRDMDAPIDAAPINLDSLRASVASFPNPTVRRALMAAIDSAQGDMEKVRLNLENWFDGAMDRVSGWYKRSTQTIIFGIALAVSVGLNLNTITIADSLYRDRALRDATVAAAAAQQSAGALGYDGALQTFDSLRLPMGWDRGWGSPRSAAEKRLAVEHELAKDPQYAQLTAADKTQRVDAALAEKKLELWNDCFAPCLGLLITTFAAMLGAPFWFDMLNRVMVIRATVKPHEKSPEEASEDRQVSRPAGPAAAVAHPPPVQFVLSNGMVAAGAAALTGQSQPENDVAAARDHAGADLDGCDVPIDEATPDEALPAATGGVKPS